MSYIFRGLVLPDELQESINNYIEYGIPLGGFLAACVENNLKEACARADVDNLPILSAIVGYLYQFAPFGCWGFPGAHQRWIAQKLAERKKKAEGN
jgi:hypothetical protein